MMRWQRFRTWLHWRTRHLGQRRWEAFKGGVSVGRFYSADKAFAIPTEAGDSVRDHKHHHPRRACWGLR
jgi:hypothetical protein